MTQAINGLKRIYKAGYSYKKTGIILMDIVGTNYMQTNLFEQIDNNESDTIMNTIDSVNRKWGKGSLFFAAQGIDRVWKLKADKRSPNYTTNWQDLPKAW